MVRYTVELAITNTTVKFCPNSRTYFCLFACLSLSEFKTHSIASNREIDIIISRCEGMIHCSGILSALILYFVFSLSNSLSYLKCTNKYNCDFTCFFSKSYKLNDIQAEVLKLRECPSFLLSPRPCPVLFFGTIDTHHHHHHYYKPHPRETKTTPADDEDYAVESR